MNSPDASLQGAVRGSGYVAVDGPEVDLDPGVERLKLAKNLADPGVGGTVVGDAQLPVVVELIRAPIRSPPAANARRCCRPASAPRRADGTPGAPSPREWPADPLDSVDRIGGPIGDRAPLRRACGSWDIRLPVRLPPSTASACVPALNDRTSPPGPESRSRRQASPIVRRHIARSRRTAPPPAHEHPHGDQANQDDAAGADGQCLPGTLCRRVRHAERRPARLRPSRHCSISIAIGPTMNRA